MAGAAQVVQSLEVEQQPRTRSRFRLFAVLTALYTIISTAVPTIASQLDSSSGYVWVMSAYLLANAAGGPIWAKLSDIWGRKPILLAAVALFFASSIACALASSMKMLIVGRAFQGAAGGGLIQLVNICVSDLFSMRERSLYLGLLEMMWAVAGGVGPVLGGAFTQKLSWRWCFWINLPISGTTFILLLVFLDVHNPKTPLLDGFRAIDWFGSLSILGLTLMLLLGLEFGGATFPWNSPQVICLIVFGSLMSIVFICSEKYLARYPLMPLELLHNKSNVASLLLVFFHGMVFIAMEYYMPLFLQAAFGASPLHSGILVIPITVSEALMGILGGIIIHRTGRYLELIYIGTTLMTIGVALYTTLLPSTSTATLIGVQILAGVGAGSLFEPPLIALQAFVAPADTATATSTLGFTRNLAACLSVVVGAAVLQNSMAQQLPALAAMGVPQDVTERLDGGGAAASVMLVSTIADPAQRAAVEGAFAAALRKMWILYAVLGACGVVASLFVARSTLSEVHVETRTGLRKEEKAVVVPA